LVKCTTNKLVEAMDEEEKGKKRKSWGRSRRKGYQANCR
jgi:hypothetical protein